MIHYTKSTLYGINEVHSTLTYQIIVQDGINVQIDKSHKINKHAGWNKAVQVGIFHFLQMQNKVLAQNYPKLKNVQDGIRACRLEFCKQLIRFAARLFDSLKYIHALHFSATP